jgi:hypothetical protein
MRWRLEVTFEEAREHLEIETQRQPSDLAIARAMPIILGLFLLVTIFASKLQGVRIIYSPDSSRRRLSVGSKFRGREAIAS